MMKGCAFVNPKEARAQHCCSEHPSATAVPTPHSQPSEDTVHAAWIKTPEYIKGL